MKRWLLTTPFDCFVQVAPGLEPLLAEELAALGLLAGAAEPSAERGGVSVALDLDGIMAVNLASRTASRVLLRLGTFPAASAEMLHDRARRLPWEVHLGFEGTYALRMASRRSKLQAGDEVARAVTGGIARRLAPLGLRPRPEPEAPLEVHVRLDHDHCTLSLNTSGEHLHRRGLRTSVGAAPARETLAAAVALLGLAQVAEPDAVVDPFCGAGTVLIEVADVLAGLLPGRARSFAFEKAAWFRPGRWREVKRRLDRASPAGPVPDPGDHAIDPAPAPHLLGIDADARALDAARANLARAGHGHVRLHHADSLEMDLGALGARQGLIVSNLPYGVRLGDAREASALSRRFLSRLGQGATRWRFALLTDDADRVASHPDARATAVVRTVSGGLGVAIVTGEVGGR